MKVLMVASDNSISSGAFRSMVMLVKHLQNDFSVEVKVVVPKHGTGEKLLQEYGLDYAVCRNYNWIVDIGNWKRKIKSSCKTVLKIIVNEGYCVRNVKKLLADEKPDIVHMNTSYTYLFAKCASELGIPVVWHLREFLEEDQNRAFFSKRYAYHLIGKSKMIAAVGAGIEEKYKTVFSDNIQTLYNGLNEQDYYIVNRKIFQNPKITFCCVGNVTEKKGQFQILKVLGELKKQGFITDFECLIAGSTTKENKQKMDEIIGSYNLQLHVKYLGVVSDTREVYRISDISFVNSYMEAFGRVTVESMLAGSLVIGADSGGTSEIISNEETGLLFEVNDERKLKDKIMYAVEHREKSRQIAKSGQKAAMGKFTSYENARQMYEIYRQALNNSWGGGGNP